MIPYYLQIGLNERVGALGIEKEDGIPTLSAVLGLINISIFEEGKISGIDGLKDKGFPALCGLGNLPDPSFFYRFLQGVETRGAQEFIIECSKKFVETGLNIGRVVNLDGKFLAYFGKKKIGKTMHPTRNKVLPGLNVFAIQDQETRNPIFLMVKYPGLKPIDIAIPLLERAMEIVGKGNLEKVIWDRWFSVGALLYYLNKHMKLKYVTIMRMHQNRIEEMKEIPVSKFRMMADGRQVAFKNTNLRNYKGKAKLIVICFEEDEEEKYYGYLTNDTASTEETIIDEYDHRWRIECLFKEMEFLGFHKLPSTELNQATMSLGTKLVACNILSSFRRDIGGDYASRELKGILKEFLREQAFVKAEGRTVHVTFYGHRHENILRPLFSDLNKWLTQKGVDGKVPWLGHRKMEFHFR